MKMYLGGQWVDRSSRLEVRHPYDGSVVDTVPAASPADAAAAVASAVRGAAAMASLPGFERYRILYRAAAILESRVEELARTITLEEGKILAEARTEASRSPEILRLSAEEAKRLHGEVIPLDGAAGGAGKLGFTLRVPCGVVVAITPFNYPSLLVCHKIGPALAAGNAVILKPATVTPLTSLRLTEALLEAGLPAEAIQCVTGPGSELGEALCSDPRVRKISFTGSRVVGERISRVAGIKKLTLELGSNAPLVILPDADLDKVADATVATGFTNAGQVCISTQRVLAHRDVYGDYLDALGPRVKSLTAGNPLDAGVKVGPLVSVREAERVEKWVREALDSGARLVAGGERSGALYAPTVVADVRPEMRISCDELFGPAVAVTRFADLDEAIALANNTEYGLSAALFTQDIDRALKFAQTVQAGNIHINWGPQWRADLMPYGGLKESGLGKEGPRYAVEEMTELKMVVIHQK
ncbi:MAG: aldehyde dehydrogenase family protein [Planctomycetes bacterium]|nr:aldehyde dehydrogenase family protein [Planctomycetota bacterium]